MTNEIKILHPFNSAVELGLRSLVLLEHAYPTKLDIQRLIYYDYLLVHSGDAGGPTSIHPATPHRSGEVLVKRKMLEQGLVLFMSRKLILRQYNKKGIFYCASDNATPFIDCLSSKYIGLLKERATWVFETFCKMGDKELDKYFRQNLDKWGGEFENEAILKFENL